MSASSTTRRPGPILHAVHRFGLPSETFIRDAITELDALHWAQWIVTEAVERATRAIPPERIVVTPRSQPLVDRVGRRLHVDRSRHAVRDISARSYLAALSRMPPGLLHAHFRWTAADCALAARKLSLPFLVSFHGTDLTVVPRDQAWSRYYPALLARADGVTVVSRFLQDKLRSIGYEGRIDLVPSGVRLAAFPFRGAPRPDGAPSLLFVGRLVPGKGVELLLRAVHQLRADGLAATLRVLGEGVLRSPFEAEVRSQGLGEAVRFLGLGSHEDVRRELERSDIVVVPSQIMPDGLEEGVLGHRQGGAGCRRPGCRDSTSEGSRRRCPLSCVTSWCRQQVSRPLRPASRTFGASASTGRIASGSSASGSPRSSPGSTSRGASLTCTPDCSPSARQGARPVNASCAGGPAGGPVDEHAGTARQLRYGARRRASRCRRPRR